MRPSMTAGRTRRWQTWCAIHGLIPMRSFPTSRPTQWRSSPSIRLPSSTATFGRSGFSRGSAMTISLCRCSGTSLLALGFPIWCPRKEAVGGARCIRLTTCSGPKARSATVAIRSITTFTRRMWRSGMWGVSVAMDRAAIMSHIRHAATLSIRRRWTMSRGMTLAFNAIPKGGHSPTDRRKILRLAGRLPRRSEARGLLAARRLYAWTKPLLLFPRLYSPQEPHAGQ